MDSRLFKPLGCVFVLSTVQKISPDTKDKVQLQVVLQQGGANSFHFANPAGRTKQIEERDSVKELLQQLLPRFRRKVNADLEEKNRRIFDALGWLQECFEAQWS